MGVVVEYAAVQLPEELQRDVAEVRRRGRSKGRPRRVDTDVLSVEGDRSEDVTTLPRVRQSWCRAAVSCVRQA
ncbi:hypothetical protein [Nocardioides sp. InS609-2]|uniref:hypothetical protein n=1 Tax=Nocardioides sp. InS609-2 TaxID=2760705 RepID=UPI0020BD5F44|nr:hypothetical protein [Nocardioides sp. InS609-2]